MGLEALGVHRRKVERFVLHTAEGYWTSSLPEVLHPRMGPSAMHMVVRSKEKRIKPEVLQTALGD